MIQHSAACLIFVNYDRLKYNYLFINLEEIRKSEGKLKRKPVALAGMGARITGSVLSIMMTISWIVVIIVAAHS